MKSIVFSFCDSSRVLCGILVKRPDPGSPSPALSVPAALCARRRHAGEHPSRSDGSQRVAGRLPQRERRVPHTTHCEKGGTQAVACRSTNGIGSLCIARVQQRLSVFIDQNRDPPDVGPVRHQILYTCFFVNTYCSGFCI